MADEVKAKETYDDSLQAGVAVRDTSGQVIDKRFNRTVADFKQAHQELKADFSSEVSRARKAEESLSDDLDTETARAKAAEQANATAIATEKSTRESEKKERDDEEATHYHAKADSEGNPYLILPSSLADTLASDDAKLPTKPQADEMNQRLAEIKNALLAMLGSKSLEQGQIEQILNGLLTVASALESVSARNDSKGHFIDVSKYVAYSTHSYDTATGKDTESFYNVFGDKIHETVTDYPFESHLKAIGFNEATASVTYQNDAGQTFTVPLTKLIDTYVGSNGDGTVITSVSGYTISATIPDGALSQSKFDQAFLAVLDGYATAEANRVTAENGRVSAESARVVAENARQANEETRQANEATRQSNEAARLAQPHFIINDGKVYFVTEQ